MDQIAPIGLLSGYAAPPPTLSSPTPPPTTPRTHVISQVIVFEFKDAFVQIAAPPGLPSRLLRSGAGGGVQLTPVVQSKRREATPPTRTHSY